MIINTIKLYEALKNADVFLKLSKFFPSPHKELIRVFSNGDGKLNLIMNNDEDMKVCQILDIDVGETVDKMYSIVLFFNIIKNVINYSTIELKDDLITFTDGIFSLVDINFPEQKKEEMFNLNFKENINDSFEVTEDVVNELRNIFRLLTLKSDRKNSYFSNNNDLYFNFSDIFIKKNSTLSFLVTDIFSLRIISQFLLKNKNSNIYYKIEDDLLILKTDNFYLETLVFKEDEEIRDYLKYYFESFNKINELKIKLEFFNFVSATFFFDENASIVFGGGKITIQSRYQKFKAEFKTDITESFIVGVNVLYKILDFIIKNNEDNYINFNIGTIDSGRFISFESGETKILTEII